MMKMLGKEKRGKKKERMVSWSNVSYYAPRRQKSSTLLW